MTHAEAFALLDAFLDEELDPVTGAGIERHVQECKICAEFLENRRHLRRILGSPQMRFRVPPELSRRLVSTAQPRMPDVGWLRAAAVATVFLISGFFVGQYQSRSDELAAQLVSAHVRSLLTDGAIEVKSSDHHTVKPWFAEKLLFSPPVPELSDHGDSLLGGRADFIAKTRVAAAVYRHGNHLVNVFVWPEKTAGGLANANLDGFHVLDAEVDGFKVALVSDLSPVELAAFRDRWVARAKP